MTLLDGLPKMLFEGVAAGASQLMISPMLTRPSRRDRRAVLLGVMLPKTLLLADRGYDADWIRELVRRQGAWANSQSHRSDMFQPVPVSRAQLNLIERLSNKIKHCRCVSTRYDKLSANYLTFVKLASIRIWLRANYRYSIGIDTRVSARNCLEVSRRHTSGQ